MVDTFEHYGIEIEFSSQAETPVISASNRPLCLVGPAKYIVDALTTTGAFNSQALLSGPAYIESTSLGAVATLAAWGVVVTGNMDIRVGNVLKQVSINPAVVTTLSQLITYLNTQFAADATIGFAGVTFGFKLVAGNYYLTLKSGTTGGSARMVVTTADAGFNLPLNVTYLGFGDYVGRKVIVPFASLPDPSSILDKTTLTASSVSVLLNTGVVTTLSKTGAWEHNMYYRPVPLAADATFGYSEMWVNGETYDSLEGVEPFNYKAAIAAPPKFIPFDPYGGEASKYWCPGTTAQVNFQASTDPTKWLNVAVTETTDPDVSTAISAAHGAKGNLKWTISAGPNSVTVNIAAGTVVVVCTLTLAGL